jgi:hypothetical protein
MPNSGTMEGGNYIQGLIACPVFEVSLGSPAAVSATAVHAAVTLGAAAQDVTTAITNPDVPRNVTVKGNASGIAGDVVITGTDANGAALSETIALSGSSEVVGNKAFKTVTNINLPAKTNGSGDTVSIGAGAKVGIGHLLSRNTVIAAYLNGVREGTAPTVVTSSSAISGNTVALSSSLAGTAVVIAYWASRL